jgi:hypothetical protein
MIKTNLTDKRPRREKFKRVIPLPSGGFVNRTAFPDGKITVYPWDSLIDAWLTEASQKATSAERDQLLFRLLEKVCNLNGCPVNDFVLGDVNAVLMTARSIQNQSKIDYVPRCPTCAFEEPDSIAVPDELELIGGKDQNYIGTDKITLPECLDVVELRPLRISDEIAISGRSQEDKKRISDHIAHIIAPIVTINDTQAERLDELSEWYLALSPADSVVLEGQTDKLSPHLNQELPQKCSKCGTVYGFQLALTEEFFRTGRVGAARRALSDHL